jgi:hypothetical protein
MYRIATIAVTCAVLLGCAAQERLAEAPSYVGPTATISDHGEPVDATKSVLFYLESIDGKKLRTSVQATRKATDGRGFRLSSKYLEHTVPARPLALKIVGTHMTAAPIQEIGLRLSGELLKVEGEVSFAPESGRDYVVYGRLVHGHSFVCIADAKDGHCLSTMVTQQTP